MAKCDKHVMEAKLEKLYEKEPHDYAFYDTFLEPVADHEDLLIRDITGIMWGRSYPNEMVWLEEINKRVWEKRPPIPRNVHNWHNDPERIWVYDDDMLIYGDGHRFLEQWQTRSKNFEKYITIYVEVGDNLIKSRIGPEFPIADEEDVDFDYRGLKLLRTLYNMSNINVIFAMTEKSWCLKYLTHMQRITIITKIIWAFFNEDRVNGVYSKNDVSFILGRIQSERADYRFRTNIYIGKEPFTTDVVMDVSYPDIRAFLTGFSFDELDGYFFGGDKSDDDDAKDGNGAA